MTDPTYRSWDNKSQTAGNAAAKIAASTLVPRPSMIRVRGVGAGISVSQGGSVFFLLAADTWLEVPVTNGHLQTYIKRTGGSDVPTDVLYFGNPS